MQEAEPVRVSGSSGRSVAGVQGLKPPKNVPDVLVNITAALVPDDRLLQKNAIRFELHVSNIASFNCGLVGVVDASQ